VISFFTSVLCADNVGEPQALAQWSRFRELSIEKLKEVYDKLNIHFDVYWGESQVKKESMERAVRICKEKNLTVYEDNGALLVDLTKFKMDRAIITKGGECISSTPGLKLKNRWNIYIPDSRSRRCFR
jgi:arginyl-tRNA synthetase